MERFSRVWMFSDLHLTRPEAPLYRSFLAALAEPVGPGDAVIFAGDIFDLLVGDSVFFKEKHREFLSLLDQLLLRGVRLFYIEGNHDFHLDRLLPRGVSFEEEAVCVLVGGPMDARRLYVAHGDLVDREDRGYLRLRSFFRSSPLRTLAHVLPGVAIEGLAQLLSRSPERKSSELPEFWSPTDLERLRSVYRQFAATVRSRGFDWVVLGHCHDLDEDSGFYFNMGYPPVHRQFLICAPDPETGKETLRRRNFPGF